MINFRHWDPSVVEFQISNLLPSHALQDCIVLLAACSSLHTALAVGDADASSHVGSGGGGIDRLCVVTETVTGADPWGALADACFAPGSVAGRGVEAGGAGFEVVGDLAASRGGGGQSGGGEDDGEDVELHFGGCSLNECS